MTDLTTTNSPASRPTSPELSPHLIKLLDSEGSPDHAAQEIASYLALREEARSALPALRAVAEHKAGEDGVRQVVSRRFSTYPQPERSEGEWAAWWADYFDVLADVPLACLEAGMRVWVGRPTSQFMPKPGELRDLAFRTPSRTLQRYQRAKRALQIADAGPTSTPRADSPPEGVATDNADAVKRMLADYKASYAARQPPTPPSRPSTAGKPDAGGLTAEMRALMARHSAAE